MGNRSGQATLMGVLLLGIAMAVFTWIASASLEDRKKDAVRFAQKLAIKAYERRLDQAFRSPKYAREYFLNENSVDGSSLTDLVKAKLKVPELQQTQLTNLRVADLDDEKKTLFGRSNTFPGIQKHRIPDFSPCDADMPEEPCNITSQVRGTLTTHDGVGFIELTVAFESAISKLNPANPENQIRLSFPVNIFGVQIQGQKILCRRGYKALLVSQSPGDFLCMLDE